MLVVKMPVQTREGCDTWQLSLDCFYHLLIGWAGARTSHLTLPHSLVPVALGSYLPFLALHAFGQVLLFLLLNWDSLWLCHVIPRLVFRDRCLKCIEVNISCRMSPQATSSPSNLTANVTCHQSAKSIYATTCPKGQFTLSKCLAFIPCRESARRAYGHLFVPLGFALYCFVYAEQVASQPAASLSKVVSFLSSALATVIQVSRESGFVPSLLICSWSLPAPSGWIYPSTSESCSWTSWRAYSWGVSCLWPHVTDMWKANVFTLIECCPCVTISQTIICVCLVICHTLCEDDLDAVWMLVLPLQCVTLNSKHLPSVCLCICWYAHVCIGQHFPELSDDEYRLLLDTVLVANRYGIPLAGLCALSFLFFSFSSVWFVFGFSFCWMVVFGHTKQNKGSTGSDQATPLCRRRSCKYSCNSWYRPCTAFIHSFHSFFPGH